jgi:hypothetical protein
MSCLFVGPVVKGITNITAIDLKGPIESLCIRTCELCVYAMGMHVCYVIDGFVLYVQGPPNPAWFRPDIPPY